MATGISVARANASIDATVALGTWIKLHTADPGAAGTASPAAETTRKQATFTSASAGAASTTALLEWTLVPAAEDFSHFTMWTASSAGSFLWSGTVTANALTIGDTFQIASGDLSLTMSGAA